MTTSTENGTAGRGIVVVLCPDLFFLVAIRNTLRRLGFEHLVVRNTDELDESASLLTPALVIVDMASIGATGDWSAVERHVRHGVPVLAFGPHRDIDAFRAAKDVGVTRVVANSQFHREMAELIERYAVQPSEEPSVPDELNLEAVEARVPPGTRHDAGDGE